MPNSEIARLTTYLAGFAVGLLALAWGVIQGDPELIALGLVITGLGGTATYNVPTIHDSVTGSAAEGRGRHAREAEGRGRHGKTEE